MLSSAPNAGNNVGIDNETREQGMRQTIGKLLENIKRGIK